MQALTDSAAFWMLLIIALPVIYLLPTLVGLIRGTDNMALVFLVNLIGTPVMIGWPAAMILAFGPRRLPPEPTLAPRPETWQWPEAPWMPGQQDPR